MPITNATLKAQATNLVEYNDTAVLTCSASTGSHLYYDWRKNNSVVVAGEGVQLSDGGATLTMVGVSRYDEGPFICIIMNNISSGVTNPVNLNISCELFFFVFVAVFVVDKTNYKTTITCTFSA